MPKKKKPGKKPKQNRQRGKNDRQQEQFSDISNDFQDGRFFYIAGYTSGGAPYGVTWEQMGLEPFENVFGDDIVESAERGGSRRYERLSKWEQDSINGKLRDSFTQYVKTYRRQPSNQKKKKLIELVFQNCQHGPVEYTKEFNAMYRKIVRKRENAFIQEGVLPARIPPTVKANWFKRSVLVESERITFRKVTQGDCEILAEFLKDPGISQAWRQALTGEQLIKWINGQQFRYRNDIVGYFMAELKDTGAFIGLMGLLWNDIGEVRVLEIRCLLKPECRGKGYAAEGVEELVKFALEVIGLNKVFAVISPENRNALRLAERTDMTEDASFSRQSVKNEYLVYSRNGVPGKLYK